MGRSQPSWARVVVMTLVTIAAVGYGGVNGANFVDLVMHGTTVDAVSLRTVEGRRRGDYTTTVDLGDGECELRAVHAEPGEHVRVIRDRTDPTRCAWRTRSSRRCTGRWRASRSASSARRS